MLIVQSDHCTNKNGGGPCFSFDGCQVEVEEGEAGLQSMGQTYESTYHETLGSCDLSVIFYS